MSPEERRRRFALLSAAISTTAMVGAVGMAVEHDEALPLRPAGPVPSPAAAIDPDAASLFLPDVPIVVRAIVKPIGKDPTGSIVATIGPAWRAILSALSKDAHALSRLSPRQLEELVAASYEQEGFDEVILTPRSGDLGRDVIATKRGFCTVRIIDQVKHYSPNHRVSADDVRALLGVLLSDERATKGFVTTTSSFAPGIAVDPFISKHMPFRLELVDGKSLLARLKGYQETRAEA